MRPWLRRLRQVRLSTVVVLTLVPGLILPTVFLDSFLEVMRVGAGLEPEVQRVLKEQGAYDLLRHKLAQAGRLLTFNRHAERLTHGHRWANDEIHIDVPGRALDALTANLPVSGETYRDISLWSSGLYRRARLRVRGNSGFHWLYDKKSLKLRTSKQDLLRGHRMVNLSVKVPYVGSLATEIADEWGLLAPQGAPVKLFVNNNFYGILRFIEEIDEGFLRRHERMPGDIFKGEGAPHTTEYHHGVPVGFLLRSPYAWPKLAEDNTSAVVGRAALEDLARQVSLPELDSVERLGRLMDMDAAMRYTAFQLFVNEWHQSDANNLKLYLDPVDGKFSFIVWDPYAGSNAATFSDRPIPERPLLNHALHKLGSDPRFMHGVFGFLAQRLADVDGLVDRARRLENHLRRSAEAIDVELDNPWFPDPRRFLPYLIGALGENRERILDRVAECDLRIMQRGNVVVLGTGSAAGVQISSLTVTADQGPEQQTLVEDRNRSLEADPGEEAVDLTVVALGDGRFRLDLEKPLLILPAYTGINRIDTRAMAFPFIIAGDARVVDVTATNPLTGATVVPTPVEHWPMAISDSYHPWDFADAPEPATITADFPLHAVTEDLVIPAHMTFVVRPGTAIVVAEGVTIRSFGRIVAEGTADRPITWTSPDQGVAWGCLALQGPEASGSSFSHVRFERGSERRFGPLRYPGMVTVHRARSVRFTSCVFSGNVVGDDCLRAADAEVDIVGCTFQDAASDAIDFDHSTGSIVESSFDRIGNDAIDLMTSDPLICGNRITRCGDKGISVGEDSRPLIFNNTITGCSIGIESKDRSRPLVLNSQITGCGIGVHAYRKNWRYGLGGLGEIVNSVLSGNDRDVVVDAGSHLVLRSCLTVDPMETSPRLTSERVHRATEAATPGGDSTIYASFRSISFTPRVGTVDTSAHLVPRRRIAEDRFDGGFSLRTRGWRLTGGFELSVRGRVLRAELDDSRCRLEKRFELGSLPPASRLLLTLSATRPTPLTIAIEGRPGEVVHHSAQVGPAEQRLVFDLADGALGSLAFTAGSPTTLRLDSVQVLGP